jgi:DNA-binding NarL/FixJ family response regulator
VGISKQLSLSGNMVAPHIESIFRKLGNSSRVDASWYATMLDATPEEGRGRQNPCCGRSG